MNLSPVITTTNNNELRTTNFEKQTQTKPILSAYAADKIVPSEVEGPITSTICMADKFAMPALECCYRGSKVEGPIKSTPSGISLFSLPEFSWHFQPVAGH
jgi:hypothetical protein